MRRFTLRSPPSNRIEASTPSALNDATPSANVTTRPTSTTSRSFRASSRSVTCPVCFYSHRWQNAQQPTHRPKAFNHRCDQSVTNRARPGASRARERPTLTTRRTTDARAHEERVPREEVIRRTK